MKSGEEEKKVSFRSCLSTCEIPPLPCRSRVCGVGGLGWMVETGWVGGWVPHFGFLLALSARSEGEEEEAAAALEWKKEEEKEREAVHVPA